MSFRLKQDGSLERWRGDVPTTGQFVVDNGPRTRVSVAHAATITRRERVQPGRGVVADDDERGREARGRNIGIWGVHAT